MEIKKRRGFSLAEVVIAFVLISLLVLIVGGVMTNSYILSTQLDKLPSAYYGAQDQVESELDALKDLVKEKYRLQNEITNTPPADLDPGLVTRLNDVNTQLSAYRSRSVSLFGKSVDLFEFECDYTSPDGTELTLNAGTANAEPLERPVPIIDSVTIHASGGAVSNELYHADGTTVYSTVSYNSKNYSYYFRDLYQWYVCTGDFHTTAYASAHEFEELLYGTVFAQYPNNFTLLPGETADSITVDSSYNGKFLVCVVTPLSIEGKMGQSVVSNYIYISNLPSLSSGSYSMVIEPSLTTYDYDSSGYVSIDQIRSRIPIGSRLISTGSRRARVSLDGAVTDSDMAASATGRGNYSRYIQFDTSSMMSGSGLSGYGRKVAFVVAKSHSGDVDFMYSGWDSYGFATNGFSLGAGGDNDWFLLAAELSDPSDFSIGGQNVDVAELILVNDPSSADVSSVLSYLANKYHIS